MKNQTKIQREKLDYDAVINLTHGGHKPNEIAEMLGVKVSRIRNALRRLSTGMVPGYGSVELPK